MARPIVAGEAAGPGAVLDLFRTDRVETRADVMRLTGMARGTVTQRINSLLEAGLLAPSDDRVSTGGRPPTKFAFNASGGCFMVADLRPRRARLALSDLAGSTLARSEERVDIADGPRPVLDSLMDWLDGLLAELDHPATPVRGIGIAVPGPVEFATGRVVSPPVMTGWDRFDIPGHVASISPHRCPVLVDNDANAMAYGEYRTGGSRHPNMIMIEAGTGIGCGIIAGGRLYRGALGAAGDLGHVPFTESEAEGAPPRCRCGNVGCFEAYAGGWALARDLLAMGHSEVEGADDIVDLIRGHDPDALGLVRASGRVLGYAISDAVSILNPSLVSVGGILTQADEQLLAGIRSIVYSHSLPLATHNLEIAITGLGEMAGIVGMNLMLADWVFEPARVDQELRASESTAV